MEVNFLIRFHLDRVTRKKWSSIAIIKSRSQFSVEIWEVSGFKLGNFYITISQNILEVISLEVLRCNFGSGFQFLPLTNGTLSEFLNWSYSKVFMKISSFRF